MRPTFKEELEKLINRYSIENESDTPDFILADLVRNILNIFAHAVKSREKWYGVYCEPGQTNTTFIGGDEDKVKNDSECLSI